MAAHPPPFHLSFPAADLAQARAFYGGVLGCAERRASDFGVDFDFFGHQLVAQFAPSEVGGPPLPPGRTQPARHFGLILSMADWEAVTARLKAAGTAFIVEPHIRSPGEAAEQATMFFLDPCGNALEFKAYPEGSAWL
jgi:extradiol dioxygenase family protein